MAEQLVEGPPNKRQKLVTPDTPTDTSEPNWQRLVDKLEAGLPEELIGTNEIPVGGSDLQQLMQSSRSTLSTSVNSTLNPSTVTASSCSALKSPALTTLTTVNSPSVSTPISSPPQMPVSTLGTPTPANPLMSSGELYLSSIGHSAAPPPSLISQMNSGLQSRMQFNSNYTSVQQYSSPQLNMMANSSPVMATANGRGSVPGGSPPTRQLSSSQDYDLCVPCYKEKGHEHKMERLGFDLDVDQQQPGNEGQQTTPLSAQEERRLKIQRCIQSIVHATSCHDTTCQITSCAKMKKVVEHTKSCKRKASGGGCRICKELIKLSCYHAKHCLQRECVMPFCRHIKNKLRQQQLQQRMHQAQTVRRRMAAMQSRVPPPVMPQQQVPGSIPPHPVMHQNNPQQMHQQPPPYVPQQPQAPQKPVNAGPPPGAVRAAQQVARDAKMQAVQATGPNSTPVLMRERMKQQQQHQNQQNMQQGMQLNMQGMQQTMQLGMQQNPQPGMQ